MDAWVGSVLPRSQSDLLLQIDIEGSGARTSLNLSDGLLRRLADYRRAVSSFLDRSVNRPYFSLVSRAFEKILHTRLRSHIHPNNCIRPVVRDGLTIPPVMEFTFLRNDRLQREDYASRFPHAADFDNTAGPSLPLPACWYRAE